MRDDTDLRQVAATYAGQWIAWDRTQTRIVAAAPSFEAAKQAAAAAGERSVVMARAPSTPATGRRRAAWSHTVAVFISLVPGMTAALPSAFQTSPVQAAQSGELNETVDVGETLSGEQA